MIDFELEMSSMPTRPALRIAVVGVGGAGGNTINALLHTPYDHVTCIAVNTDVKALEVSKSQNKLQIGIKSAKGLGSGANPELGKRAAEEDIAEIMELLQESDIVFLTGGLGGGTGSGALPVIARAIKERDILSIAVVTKPFSFEGKRRMKIADEAEILLRKEVDTLITIPNQKLLTLANEQLSLVRAFEMVNDITCQLVRSIADIVSKPGYINVDFADLKAIMKGMGLAVMGTGKASGEDRAEEAAYAAINCPLLENVSIKGARSVLINVTGSSDLGLLEVSKAASLITREAHEDANIILGSVIDDSMQDEVSVTVIATGFHMQQAQTVKPALSVEKLEKTEEPAAQVAPKHPLKELLLQEVAKKEHKEVSKDLEVPTLLRKMVQEKRLQQKN